VSPWDPRRNGVEVIVNHAEVNIMHLNKPPLPGCVGRQGAELRHDATDTPTCALVVETDKAGTDGQVYASFHEVDLIGRLAKDLSVTLESGDAILVAGAPHDRPTVGPKTPQQHPTGGLSTRGVRRQIRARATVERVGGMRDPDPVGLAGELVVRNARAGDRLRQPELLRR
jgi:hypothetical protein